MKLTWVVDIPRSKFVEHCHGPRRVDSSGSDLSIVVAVHHVPKVPCGTGDFIVTVIILSKEHPRGLIVTLCVRNAFLYTENFHFVFFLHTKGFHLIIAKNVFANSEVLSFILTDIAVTCCTPHLNSPYNVVDLRVIGVLPVIITIGCMVHIDIIARHNQNFNNNRDLFRPGASFVVIYVSDEPAPSPLSVATYFQEMQVRFGGDVIAAAVAGHPSCPNTSFSGRYEDIVQFTGGILEPICSGWAQSLANVGQLAFGVRSVFSLQLAVDAPNSIVVTVDGMPATGWTYDPVANAVRFSSPPPEGSTIEISYRPSC